ncbi:F0F1 ATP synthase subunit B [Candidatus Daviesbacteria bacterium]|nr:F0F1 ATP synthase subunit B [Candidatus Daviesbacteria bacterium]
MNFLTDFGVKPILLIAQVVNFLLLLLILKKFLYKPILKVLEERKQKIADSLKNAQAIEEKLQKTEEDREKRLADARQEAKVIIDEAGKGASQIMADAKISAQQEIERLVEKSKIALELERTKMERETRAGLAELVVTSLEKVVGRAVTDKDRKNLIEKSVKGLS